MHRPAGIKVCGANQPVPDYYSFNSRWDGTVNGQRVTVFAGALRGNPHQGVLLVRAFPQDRLREQGRQIAGPASAGLLRLIGWAGSRLKVLAENGDAIWFEVPVAVSAVRSVPGALSFSRPKIDPAA
jgi:hypothetical protein